MYSVPIWWFDQCNITEISLRDHIVIDTHCCVYILLHTVQSTGIGNLLEFNRLLIETTRCYIVLFAVFQFYSLQPVLRQSYGRRRLDSVRISIFLCFWIWIRIWPWFWMKMWRWFSQAFRYRISISICLCRLDNHLHMSIWTRKYEIEILEFMSDFNVFSRTLWNFRVITLFDRIFLAFSLSFLNFPEFFPHFHTFHTVLSPFQLISPFSIFFSLFGFIVEFYTHFLNHFPQISISIRKLHVSEDRYAFCIP